MGSLLLDHAIPTSLMLHRINVNEFHQMMEYGILRDGDPVELIDGLVVQKDRRDDGGEAMSHGPRQRAAIRRLQELDAQLAEHPVHFCCQLPVTLSQWEEPEPDGAVIRGSPVDYETAHPVAEDIIAVIDASDSSLNYDRTTKQQLYAEAGIAVYWIINLRNRCVEVYETPDAKRGEYRRRRDYEAGETIELTLDGDASITVNVSDLLPAT